MSDTDITRTAWESWKRVSRGAGAPEISNELRRFLRAEADRLWAEYREALATHGDAIGTLPKSMPLY